MPITVINFPCLRGTSVRLSYISCILFFYRRCRGGLQPGDVLVSINDVPVSSSQDVYRKLETKEDAIKVSIIRKNEHLNFLITLEDIPQ